MLNPASPRKTLSADELRVSRSKALRAGAFPCRCTYSGPQWMDAHRCAHCGGLLSRVMDTGRWHGPVEGFIVDDGVLAGEGIETSSNGAMTFATIRVERRAADARDVSTLLALAREHDATGAIHAAEHCRALAGIFGNAYRVHGPARPIARRARGPQRPQRY
jgi:hypothetical protein